MGRVSSQAAPPSTLDRPARRWLRLRLLWPHGPRGRSVPSVLLLWCVRAAPASCHPCWLSAAVCPVKIQNHQDSPAPVLSG